MLTDLNDRIAKAKGWFWSEIPSLIAPYQSVDGLTTFRSSVPTHWINPEGEPATRPDFVGTLEGVAGMMRILGPEWSWGWDGTQYICCDEEGYGFPVEEFCSSNERPGDCVGAAYMSVFGKEDSK